MPAKKDSTNYLRFLILLPGIVSLVLAACGGGSGSSGDTDVASSNSNRAQFTFDCDLSGVNGEMLMQIEAVGNSGVTWGTGPNPDITGVIGTGAVTYFVEGNLISSSATYVFSGENQYADFTQTSPTIERFLVEWVSTANGVDIIINPFGPGPGPARQSCVLTSSAFI